MFQVAGSADEQQAVLDILNAQKFRDLTARAANLGLVMYIGYMDVDDADAVDPEAGGLGRFTLPLHERLANIEADIEAEELGL